MWLKPNKWKNWFLYIVQQLWLYFMMYVLYLAHPPSRGRGDFCGFKWDCPGVSITLFFRLSWRLAGRVGEGTDKQGNAVCIGYYYYCSTSIMNILHPECNNVPSIVLGGVMCTTVFTIAGSAPMLNASVHSNNLKWPSGSCKSAEILSFICNKNSLWQNCQLYVFRTR